MHSPMKIKKKLKILGRYIIIGVSAFSMKGNSMKKLLKKEIRKLAKENEQLRTELKKYNAKNLMKLVDDTLRERARYMELSKELEVLRDEYRELVREQKRIMK